MNTPYFNISVRLGHISDGNRLILTASREVSYSILSVSINFRRVFEEKSRNSILILTDREFQNPVNLLNRVGLGFTSPKSNEFILNVTPVGLRRIIRSNDLQIFMLELTKNCLHHYLRLFSVINFLIISARFSIKLFEALAPPLNWRVCITSLGFAVVDVCIQKD